MHMSNARRQWSNNLQLSCHRSVESSSSGRLGQPEPPCGTDKPHSLAKAVARAMKRTLAS
jgi:hypothetical protein